MVVQVYGSVVMCSVIASTAISIVEKLPTKTLPVRGWFPYNHDNNQIGFWVAWIHQNIAFAYHGSLAIAFDTVCFGTMIQISSQIKILGHRIYNIPMTILQKIQSENKSDNYKKWEQQTIVECIQHHLLILRLS